ncbi:hypothetical protein C8J56DRAFT_890548 [Mycena floridula]|nr:hypothetical protein C8J56DRAFT_890548 [Mycena floridula]
MAPKKKTPVKKAPAKSSGKKATKKALLPEIVEDSDEGSVIEVDSEKEEKLPSSKKKQPKSTPVKKGAKKAIIAVDDSNEEETTSDVEEKKSKVKTPVKKAKKVNPPVDNSEETSEAELKTPPQKAAKVTPKKGSAKKALASPFKGRTKRAAADSDEDDAPSPNVSPKKKARALPLVESDDEGPPVTPARKKRRSLHKEANLEALTKLTKSRQGKKVKHVSESEELEDAEDIEEETVSGEEEETESDIGFIDDSAKDGEESSVSEEEEVSVHKSAIKKSKATMPDNAMALDDTYPGPFEEDTISISNPRISFQAPSVCQVFNDLYASKLIHDDQDKLVKLSHVVVLTFGAEAVLGIMNFDEIHERYAAIQSDIKWNFITDLIKMTVWSNFVNLSRLHPCRLAWQDGGLLGLYGGKVHGGGAVAIAVSVGVVTNIDTFSVAGPRDDKAKKQSRECWAATLGAALNTPPFYHARLAIEGVIAPGTSKNTYGKYQYASMPTSLAVGSRLTDVKESSSFGTPASSPTKASMVSPSKSKFTIKAPARPAGSNVPRPDKVTEANDRFPVYDCTPKGKLLRPMDLPNIRGWPERGPPAVDDVVLVAYTINQWTNAGSGDIHTSNNFQWVAVLIDSTVVDDPKARENAKTKGATSKVGKKKSFFLDILYYDFIFQHSGDYSLLKQLQTGTNFFFLRSPVDLSILLFNKWGLIMAPVEGQPWLPAPPHGPKAKIY